MRHQAGAGGPGHRAARPGLPRTKPHTARHVQSTGQLEGPKFSKPTNAHDFPIFVKLHRLYLAFGRPRSSKQLELFRYLFSLPRYGEKKIYFVRILYEQYFVIFYSAP